MPGLVKVGFSTKDPKVRADELNHTGAPHPYIVQFDVLVEHPHEIEKRAHSDKKQSNWPQVVTFSASSTKSSVDATPSQDDKPLDEARGVDSTSTIRAAPVSANDRREINRMIKIRHTASYVGTCAHCGSPFTVTLTRYDSGAACPVCFRQNNVADFIRRELIL